MVGDRQHELIWLVAANIGVVFILLVVNRLVSSTRLFCYIYTVLYIIKLNCVLYIILYCTYQHLNMCDQSLLFK